MTTKRKKQLKQCNAVILLLIASVMAVAQERGYLTNRIKPGDIFYLDNQGNECFMDYRLWDRDNPPGEAQGVVFYSYYGTFPSGVEGGEEGWHGWIAALDEVDSLVWAPENSLCYDTVVALYPVEGISTPWNPYHEAVAFAIGDTCGWQNTQRFLEFVYTGSGTVLSDAVSSAFTYLFTEKNGIDDFSQKPIMTPTSWYLMGLGQLRVLYGYAGCVNSAMAACGGTLLSNNKKWLSSTEVGVTRHNGVWYLYYDGSTPSAPGWLKHYSGTVRAVRSF